MTWAVAILAVPLLAAPLKAADDAFAGWRMRGRTETRMRRLICEQRLDWKGR